MFENLNPFKAIGDGIKAYGSYKQEKLRMKSEEAHREHELRVLKHSADIAKIERGETIVKDYDELAMKLSEKTLVDDLLIGLIFSATVMLFIPSLAPYAIAGFAELGKIPVVYQAIIVGIFASKIGLRWIIQPLVSTIGRKK